MSASSRLLDVGQSLLHMHFGTRVLFFSGIRSTWHSLGESHLNSLQGLQCPLETTARSSIRFSHAIRFKWHSDGYSRPFEPVFIIWVQIRNNQENINLFFYFNKGKFHVLKYLPHTIVSSDKVFAAQISGQWQLAELPSNVALQWAYLGHDNFEQGSPFGPEIDIKLKNDDTQFLIYPWSIVNDIN